MWDVHGLVHWWDMSTALCSAFFRRQLGGITNKCAHLQTSFDSVSLGPDAGRLTPVSCSEPWLPCEWWSGRGWKGQSWQIIPRTVDLAVGGLSRMDCRGWVLWSLYLLVWLAQMAARSPGQINMSLVSCFGGSVAIPVLQIIGASHRWISTACPWHAGPGRLLCEDGRLCAGGQVTESLGQLGSCPPGYLDKWRLYAYLSSFWVWFSFDLLTLRFFLPVNMARCCSKPRAGESKRDPRLSFSVHVGVWYPEDTESGAGIVPEREGWCDVWMHELVLDTEWCYQMGSKGGRQRVGALLIKHSKHQAKNLAFYPETDKNVKDFCL